MQAIAFDLIQQKKKKKDSVTEEKSMVKSDQCLRLFSSRRQPSLLVFLPSSVNEHSYSLAIPLTLAVEHVQGCLTRFAQAVQVIQSRGLNP